MHVATLEIELRIPLSRSLKEKRAVVKPILEGARRRFQVAAAEVGFQDKWQRAAIGFAAVGGDREHVTNVISGVERFVWSFPEADVVDARLELSTAGDDA